MYGKIEFDIKASAYLEIMRYKNTQEILPTTLLDRSASG